MPTLFLFPGDLRTRLVQIAFTAFVARRCTDLKQAGRIPDWTGALLTFWAWTASGWVAHPIIVGNDIKTAYENIKRQIEYLTGGQFAYDLYKGRV